MTSPSTITITSDRASLALASNPYESLLIGTTQGALDTGSNGEVLVFAGGAEKFVTYEGGIEQLPVVLVHLSPYDLRQLISWKGQTLLFRTVDGYSQYVVFYRLSIERRLRTNADDGSPFTYDVELNLQRVSYNPDSSA